MRGDLSFEKSPFNSVDALILSQISYNNIDGLVPAGFDSSITMAELAQSFLTLDDYAERCNMGAMINALTPVLLQKAAESKRFGNIRVSGFINKIDEEKVEQFCAVTYEIEKERLMLCIKDKNK